MAADIHTIDADFRRILGGAYAPMIHAVANGRWLIFGGYDLWDGSSPVVEHLIYAAAAQAWANTEKGNYYNAAHANEGRSLANLHVAVIAWEASP